MIYRIDHRTAYHYAAPVSRARNVAHLRPRTTPAQRCLDHTLVVDPGTVTSSDRIDYFGNPVATFVVDGPFDHLTVRATSTVAVAAPVPLPTRTPPWEQVRDRLATGRGPDLLAAREFCFASPLVDPTEAVRSYAAPSFTAGRPVAEAVVDLAGRIHAEFTYDPGVTTVATPVDDVLADRRGVCQDFAHLAIGCFRAVGLAARYVSGYLETSPPDGTARVVGADASHAWPSVYLPEWGWFDVDPTNDTVVGTTYVTTAWGRDYDDVSPLKGIVFGGGAGHELEVSVDVTRVDGEPPAPDIPAADG